MSDYGNDDDQGQEPEGIAALRRAADAGKAASKENEALKKKVTFMELGISPASEIGGMLFDTWDGQDVEGLKAKAIRLGALKAEGTPDPDKEPDKSPEEIEALNRIEAEAVERAALQRKLSGGGQSGGREELGAHPVDAALEDFQQQRKRGVSEDIAQRDVMAKVLTAGHVNRDPRMVYDHEAHLELGREMDREYEGRSS